MKLFKLHKVAKKSKEVITNGMEPFKGEFFELEIIEPVYGIPEL